MTTTEKTWDELEETRRRELELQYLKELSMMSLPGLTEGGVEAYLAYRRDRPGMGITTYEEGQLRKLMHRFIDPTKVRDPVEEEEHTGKLDKFGAQRLHMTSSQTYVAIMVTLNLLFLLILLFILM
jgi:hypothetical protein